MECIFCNRTITGLSIEGACQDCVLGKAKQIRQALEQDLCVLCGTKIDDMEAVEGCCEACYVKMMREMEGRE